MPEALQGTRSWGTQPLDQKIACRISYNKQKPYKTPYTKLYKQPWNTCMAFAPIWFLSLINSRYPNISYNNFYLSALPAAGSFLKKNQKFRHFYCVLGCFKADN